MAGRMDERGYVENGNPRQREPFRGPDYDEEPRRMTGRNRRRDEREFEREPTREFAREPGPESERDEPQDDRRFDRPQRPRFARDSLPLRMSSTLSDAFVSAFERGAQALGENMRLYQDETVRFVAERLEHDTQMLEQLGKSRSMFDLFQIQQRWLSAATRAYSDEFMRLSKLTGDVTQRTASEQRQALSETRRAAYDAE